MSKDEYHSFIELFKISQLNSQELSLKRFVLKYWIDESSFCHNLNDLVKEMVNFVKNNPRKGKIEGFNRCYEPVEYFEEYKRDINLYLSTLLNKNHCTLVDLIRDENLKNDPLILDERNKKNIAWFVVEDITKSLCYDLVNFYKSDFANREVVV